MNVREIPLPCGRVAIVSEEDYPRASTIRWSTNGRGYVRGRWRQALGGHGGNVYLHRFIAAAPAGMVVDHIDSNPLNNTRDKPADHHQRAKCHARSGRRGHLR